MVLVMRVKSDNDVVGSKNLRHYVFEAPGVEDLVVVANLTNVYAENDLVMVALVDTMLPNNFKIEKRKLFGIESSGMALGKTTAEIGSIVPEEEIIKLFS